MTRLTFVLSLVVAAAVWIAPREAEAQSEATKAARDLFEMGKKAYNLGEFDKAIELWKQGYEKKDDPIFLFNIAQAYRQKQDYAKAIFFYKAYLREDPDSKNRPVVEQRIADLQKLLDAERSTVDADPKGVGEIEKGSTEGGTTGGVTTGEWEGGPGTTETAPPERTPEADPQPDPEPTPITDEPAPGKGMKIAGIVVGGSGVALLVTGVVFALKASSLESDVESAVANGTPWNDELASMHSDGQSASTISKITIGVGIVAIAAGTTLFILGSRKASAARETSAGLEITPSIAPGSAGVVLSWTY